MQLTVDRRYVALTSLDVSRNRYPATFLCLANAAQMGAAACSVRDSPFSISRLESLPSSLVNLDASHNILQKVQGLDGLAHLEILNLSHNEIEVISCITDFSPII